MAGLQVLSDENVKAPNLLDRAKKEIQTVLHNNEKLHLHRKETREIDEQKSLRNVKAPNVFDRAKEEIKALIQTFHPKNVAMRHLDHYKETHGRRDDINENTPIDEIKGPSIFERAKEEVEALIGTIHQKKESLSNNSVSSPEKEGGFGAFIGGGLEKVCSGGFISSIGRGLEKVCSPTKDSNKDY